MPASIAAGAASQVAVAQRLTCMDGALTAEPMELPFDQVYGPSILAGGGDGVPGGRSSGA